MRFRPRALGLRARITLAFGLGSLLLAVALATSTWAFTRESQLNLRETEQLDTLVRNATRVRNALTSESTDVLPFLQTLSSNAESKTVRVDVSTADASSISDLPGAFDDIPLTLRETVEGGEPAMMHFRRADTPVLALGVPLPTVDAAYYEIVQLRELERSLDLLAAYLTGASILITLAGATLGWWASRRTLLPLADVGLAAHAIAGGRLDTRLEVANDPDLSVLVSSFNEMAATLQARIERDARFASDVSHELRSPLMTLSASIEVLSSRREEMPDASAQAAIDLMVADVARFKQLVEDLLEISRFDAGAARLELSELRPGELVTQAVAWSETPDVPIELDSDLAGVLVRADKRRLVRVITNLLDNARKYGGGATRIELRRLPDGLLIAVEDNGTGVPPEERELIFDRFSRGAGSNRRAGSEGVGLGLSLVSEHVALHKGRVWMEDRPDGMEGARFCVELPVAWDEDLEPPDEDVP